MLLTFEWLFVLAFCERPPFFFCSWSVDCDNIGNGQSTKFPPTRGWWDWYAIGQSEPSAVVGHCQSMLFGQCSAQSVQRGVLCMWRPHPRWVEATLCRKHDRCKHSSGATYFICFIYCCWTFMTLRQSVALGNCELRICSLNSDRFWGILKGFTHMYTFKELSRVRFSDTDFAFKCNCWSKNQLLCSYSKASTKTVWLCETKLYLTIVQIQKCNLMMKWNC